MAPTTDGVSTETKIMPRIAALSDTRATLELLRHRVCAADCLDKRVQPLVGHRDPDASIEDPPD